MNKKHVIMIVVGGVVLYVVYRYLSGARPQQTVNPDTQPSGAPQGTGSQWNIGTAQPQPNPGLIYSPPPTLPATPPLQYYNYAPLNIWNLTPQAAAGATVPAPGSVPSKSCDSCSCSSCSTCPTCPTGGQYLDAATPKCLAANPKQQATNPAGSPVVTQQAANLQDFFNVPAISSMVQ